MWPVIAALLVERMVRTMRLQSSRLHRAWSGVLPRDRSRPRKASIALAPSRTARPCCWLVAMTWEAGERLLAEFLEGRLRWLAEVDEHLRNLIRRRYREFRSATLAGAPCGGSPTKCTSEPRSDVKQHGGYDWPHLQRRRWTTLALKPPRQDAPLRAPRPNLEPRDKRVKSKSGASLPKRYSQIVRDAVD
jgi:hypothetical protein